MSTCISRHGEYGSHTFEDPEQRFTCSWCGVLNEDALYAALEEAERERNSLATAYAQAPSCEAQQTCRALVRADRHEAALDDLRERIGALADEWEQMGREAEAYINRAHHSEIHEVTAEARWFPERASDLRALLEPR